MGFNQGHTDDDLILGVQNGSEEAFALLYKKYEGKLMGYLIFKLKNPEIAEEVFQISWSKCLDNIHKYKFTDSFSSWLFTIATNSVKDWFKKSSNYTKLLETFKNEKAIEQESLNNNKSLSLDIHFLKEDAKQIIEFQYIEGLSSKEISKKMNITESNVRKISSRARLEIKSHILNGGNL